MQRTREFPIARRDSKETANYMKTIRWWWLVVLHCVVAWFLNAPLAQFSPQTRFAKQKLLYIELPCIWHLIEIFQCMFPNVTVISFRNMLRYYVFIIGCYNAKVSRDYCIASIACCCSKNEVARLIQLADKTEF